MTHRSSGLDIDTSIQPTSSVSWEGIRPVEEWLKSQPVEKWKDFFEENGYLMVEGLIGPQELEIYIDIYNKMLDGAINTSKHRHDLGNIQDQKIEGTENITQIMWPCLYVDGLEKGPIHQRTCAVAKKILGDDIAFDFDMLIAKAPHTNTITPWHADVSYWPDMPDKRAVTCWCAMDDADVDNGCMWFVPGSHKKPMRAHRPAAPGVHLLTCDGTEEEGQHIPLKAGSCTFHHGGTVHYTRGNTTDRNRRAYITNFRPQAMVDYERQINYDHGKKGFDVIKAKGDVHKQHIEA